MAVRDDADMGSDERDDVVERVHAIAGDLLIEELGFFFVDGRGRERNENFAVNWWREFHSEELDVADDGRAGNPQIARVCMSSINSSVLLRRSPNDSGGGVQGGSLLEIIHPKPMSTSKAEGGEYGRLQ